MGRRYEDLYKTVTDYIATIEDVKQQRYLYSLLLDYIDLIGNFERKFNIDYDTDSEEVRLLKDEFFDMLETKLNNGCGSYKPQNSIQTVLERFKKELNLQKGGSEKYQELIREVQKIIEDEYGDATMFAKLRAIIVDFGLRNSLSTYMFKEIDQLFNNSFAFLKAESEEMHSPGRRP